MPFYYHINVPWGGANQDDQASGLVHERPQNVECNYCRVGVTWKKQERIIIEEGSWNGTDIFIPRNAPIAGFMVSERFKNIIGKYYLKNFQFIPAEKFAYNERRWGLWYINDE